MRKPTIPSYRKHKASGQAVVTIHGRDHYLGRHGTQESKDAYQRLVAEFLSRPGLTPGEPMSVAQLVESYVEAVRHLDAAHQSRIKSAVKPLVRLYGATPAKSFGPLSLNAVRNEYVSSDKNYCRTNINHLTQTVRRLFKWAVAHEVVGVEVYDALLLMPDIRECDPLFPTVRESEPVVPVPIEDVEPVLAFCLPIVADMARIQLLTGARGGEICIMRPIDVDRSRNVWEYRPSTHKTKHRGMDRIIFLGPRAQAILAPYLLRPAESFCFSPREAISKRRQAHQGTRRPGERYRASSYSHAIAAACEAYNRKAEQLEAEARRFGQTLEVRRIPPWHVHALRHAAATQLVNEFGEEVAMRVLGQATMKMIKHYSKKAHEPARRAMGQIG